jgi:aspartyl protease family protein
MVRFLVIGLVATLCAIGAARELAGIGADTLADQTPHPVAMPAPAPPPVAQPAEPVPDTYGEAAIARSPDGEFWADAQVDGYPVHFLVDTGASIVALTQADAHRMGIDPSATDYTIPISTANGMTRAAPVKLHLVSVGRAEVSEVDAVVAQGGLSTSLLGMSYLRRLSKFEATPDALVLKS